MAEIHLLCSNDDLDTLIIFLCGPRYTYYFPMTAPNTLLFSKDDTDTLLFSNYDPDTLSLFNDDPDTLIILQWWPRYFLFSNDDRDFIVLWLKGYCSSCYYRHQIGSINLTHYHFYPGCVPKMFVTSYSVTYCICIPEKLGFFSLLLCSLRWVQMVKYVLVCRSHYFVCTLHHLIIIIV